MCHLAIERTCLGDLAGHVRERESQRLEVADRVAELLALLQVDGAVFDRGLRQPDGPRCGVHPRHVEPRPYSGEPALGPVPGADEVLSRDAHPVEEQGPR